MVEKGFFFPTDYHIPTGAIARYDGDKVHLNVTKDAAISRGWDREPLAGDYGTATGAVAESDRLRVPFTRRSRPQRTRVAEEAGVTKEAVRPTETVGGTVHREEVRVEEDVADDAARTAGFGTGRQDA